MKKHIIIAFVLSAVCLFAKDIVVIADANIRDLPNVSKSKVVARATIDGVRYPVLEEFADWVKIESANVSGYVYGGMIDVKNGVIIAPEGCAVQTGEGNDTGRAGIVKKGEAVKVLGGKTMWYRIDAGWVSAGYVKVVEAK
jgi:hypothetical protein